MNVRIPTPLRSYTNAAVVDAEGSTLDELIHDLDRRYPGIRFRFVDEQGRLRQHMKIFVGMDMTRDLSIELDPTVEVTVMQALSGG